MVRFKPIKSKKAYEKLIADKIIKWQWDYIFKPCLNILKDDNVENNNNAIINAIKSGLIYYNAGAFYSTRNNRFSNSIALELEKIGAKYSKLRKAYVLAESKIPLDIAFYLANSTIKNIERTNLIKDFLKSGLIIDSIKNLIFDTAIETIVEDLEKEVKRNFENNKLQTITPTLTDKRAKDIAENYTNNMQYYIKKWTEKDITKMREVVGQMAIEGQSRKGIEKYIEKNFNVAKDKAKFLARNETGIAVTEYLKSKYQEEGFDKFYWITNYDGKERELHAELGKETNNKYGIDGKNIFRFNDPPVIDERTGQRGLPRETYNCRCSLVPYIDKTFAENRKKMYYNNSSKG